jgi:dynactin complex subunit
VKEAEKRGRQQGLKSGKESAAHEVEAANAVLERLRRQLACFKQATGIDVERSWQYGDITKALEFVKRGGVDAAKRDVDSLLARARAQVKALEDVQTMCEEFK